MGRVDGSRYDIVIAGGSFAGLTLARAMAMCLGPEIAIAVVDPAGFASGSAAPDARASAISSGSWQLLAALGLADSLKDAVEPVLAINITDSPLEAALRPRLLSYENVLADGSPASMIIENAALKQALEAVVRDTPGIELIGGTEITDLEVSAERATATLGDGRTINAALVVAADGRRSRLRELAGLKTTGWSSGQVGIVTNIFHAKPHQGRAVQHFLPSGPFAALPLKDRAGKHSSSIVWTEEAETGRRLVALNDERFLEEIERRLGGRLGSLALDGARGVWPLETHLARSYIAPRFALVGDAAHGVHPLAGQGLNLAFRDVAALTECLVDSARLGLDLGTDEVLERYQRWRRADSTLSAAAFDGINRLFASDSGLLRAVRGIGLGLVDRVDGLKRQLVVEAAGLGGDVPKLMRGEMV